MKLCMVRAATFMALAWALANACDVRAQNMDAERIAAERHILKAIEERGSIQFVEDRLSEVAMRLKEDTRVPFALDMRALEDESISSELSITKDLQKLPWRTILGSLLRDHGLTWVIYDEQVLITTEAAANRYVTRRTYEVSDLVLFKDGESRYFDFEELTTILKSTVAPESWEKPPAGVRDVRIEFDEHRPRGSIAASHATGSMVVLQRVDIHAEIEAQLAALRAAREKQGIEGPVERPRAAAKPAAKTPASP